MFAKIDGVGLFYTTHGTGRRLMLMHGGMGFENSGHFPSVEEQEQFNKIVSDWVAKLK